MSGWEGAPAGGPAGVGELAHERALVAAAIDGDGLAFRALVEPHLGVLYRIAARLCGDPQLAEDAVQDTLTVVYERLERYQPGSSFRAFVAAVAARRAATLARAERRRQRRERDAARPVAPPGPEEQALGHALERRLRLALAQLSYKRRAAVLLRLDAGLSYRAIAQALRTSEGAARVLVHQGTRQLRAALSDALSGTPAPSSAAGGRSRR